MSKRELNGPQLAIASAPRVPSPPFERMRQYRRRRRWKRLIVRVELDGTEIGVLVSRGYLNPREKENLDAIQQAANDFISDAMLP